VSATFAASLVISPALGSIIQHAYGNQAVYFVSSAFALADVLFIIFFVPEVSGTRKTTRTKPL
jgi:predicted MFS family arabinose efflux permease